MEPVINVEHVDKSYGSERVLRDVCMECARGTITGIVGRNGSGKTVLLKCILGLTKVNAGRITVNGKCVGHDIDFPRRMGFIVNEPGFLPNYSGYANLKFLSSIGKHLTKADINEVLSKVGLGAASKKHVGKYSLGMKQRLGIAQAIMEDPDILLLDEPMNGLDNTGVRDMRQLFKELRARGKTIILASHNPLDIEELCDNVCEMDVGKLRQIR